MQQHLREDKALPDDELPRTARAASQRNDVEQLLTSQAPVALYLDIDGTLLDVALTPSTVHVPPELPDILSATSVRLSGAIAIVTGRRIVEADHLLKPIKFAAAGVHGAEMRMSPTGKVVSLTPSFSPVLIEEIKAIAKALPGIVLEDKGAGIALHYRIVPELQGSLLQALEALVPRHPGQFVVCEGRKVVEVLPIGFSKGRALRKLAALPKFANRVPIMIGDDIADVGAFRAAEEMGGYGLKVAGENFTNAEASFRGPSEVVSWLKAFSDGL
jgi:trehalose 6-phosphate phosphatase